MIEASLVPETFFEGFRPESIWVLWVMAAGAIGVLVYGADRLVSGAVRLAKAMGLPTVVIGATVVSLGTTTPEACVSVNAALHGEPGLALEVSGPRLDLHVSCHRTTSTHPARSKRDRPSPREVLSSSGKPAPSPASSP